MDPETIDMIKGLSTIILGMAVFDAYLIYGTTLTDTYHQYKKQKNAYLGNCEGQLEMFPPENLWGLYKINLGKLK